MVNQFTIGVDFGTESGRAVLVSIKDGSEIAEHVTEYSFGVIDQVLPTTGEVLPTNWALQDPNDYLRVIKEAIPAVIQKAGVDSSQVLGIGIDFTACTMLPVDRDGQPLCFDSRYKDSRYSWVKLWKHHAAQPDADRFNTYAKKSNQTFLKRYGGKISSEWMFPKIIETLNHDKRIYDAADRFVEALDWIVFKLTGQWSKSSCAAGYKANWHKQAGYPSSTFLKTVDKALTDLSDTKLRGEIMPSGSKAGCLTIEMSEILGLDKHTAVATGMIDAHASVPALGVVSPGKMVMAMGTSICHMVLSDKEEHIEGISGVVEDGIIPNLFGYEAGQPAGGDTLAWFVNHAVPDYIKSQAREEKCSVHNVLEKKASILSPGESGLLALDWFNGNRSTLVDANLTGMLLGLTLSTRPEEIYRALIESLAFGTRKIIETFEAGDVKVDALYACGGLAMKNELLMQIYADVTQKTIYLADTLQTAACGSGIYAAVAAGAYQSMAEAVDNMSRLSDKVYYPNENAVEIYEVIYQEYQSLYHLFGQENDLMHRLNRLKNGGK